MYLYQKFGYVVKELEIEQDVGDMVGAFRAGEYEYTVFDTETDGLDIIQSQPFLFVFGFGKYLYSLDLTKEEHFVDYALRAMYFIASKSSRLFAHNMQFDMNMMENFGRPLLKNINLADSTIVFRLTTYADDLKNRSLKAIGKDLVDDEANFADQVISRALNQINSDRKKIAEPLFREKYADNLKEDGRFFSKVWHAYLRERVAFVEHEYEEYFEYLDTVYERATYKSVFEERRNLMMSYAYDDLVIMIEYLEKALPVLMETDPGLKTFNRECKMLRISQAQERTGLLVDIDYMLESRERMIKYQSEKYKEFHKVMGQEITVGQHQVIRELFASNWGTFLMKADKATFEQLKQAPPDAMKAADLIVELRTVDKWISTYIDGMLNRIVDGRLYTNIDNTGTITGRVSSNFQQQPKDGFYDGDVELFHPRRPFIPDPGYTLYSLDYSQHELRVQAFWTIKIAEGDLNLCRAYMPFECYHKASHQKFDYTNKKMLESFGGEEWVEIDTGNIWRPIDLHSVTTQNAFPDVEVGTEEFEQKRHLGKMANFLKNYGGGMGALMSSLNVDRDLAKQLDDAYYNAYPKIRDYQSWVNAQVSKYGFAENLYGRRYYFRNSRYAYKLYNYLVQGSCADMLKEVQIKISEVLVNYESYITMPIHDEILVLVKDGEEEVVDIIMDIMTEQPEEIPYIPMKVGAEKSRRNWRDLK